MARIRRGGSLGEAPWVYSPEDSYAWSLKGQTGGVPNDPDGPVLTDVVISLKVPAKFKVPTLAKEVWDSQGPYKGWDKQVQSLLGLVEHFMRGSKLSGSTKPIRLEWNEVDLYHDPSKPISFERSLATFASRYAQKCNEEMKDLPSCSFTVSYLGAISAKLKTTIRLKRGGSWLVTQEVIGSIRMKKLFTMQEAMEKRLPGLKPR